MGKRKRLDSNIEKLLKEVKKLVKKKRRDARRVSSSSSSSANDSEISDNALMPDELNLVYSSSEEPTVETIGEPTVEPLQETILDPEVFGSDPTDNKIYGDNLHKDLATRWRHILTNGLAKEEKMEIIKLYLPPENCDQLKAPILNMEIKSAISELNVKRDAYSESKQNQIASSIAAIGKAISLVLPLSGQIPREAIKTLSDAARLLCDSHYRESLARRFAIVNLISKPKREIMKKTKIDTYLFGSDLSEQLKSSKFISQTASELKMSTNRQSFNQQRVLQHRRPGTLNVRGAPRAPATEQRAQPQPRRPPPAPTAQRDQRRGTATRLRATNYQHPRRH